MQYEDLKDADYLQLAVEDLENDPGDFYNWVIDMKGSVRDNFLIDILPPIAEMIYGNKDKLDCATDLVKELEPYLISYAKTNAHLCDKWEEEQTYNGREE